MSKNGLLIDRRTIWSDFRDIAIPMFLIIDMYYRTEWFYLHTNWGPSVLGVFFGGGH